MKDVRHLDQDQTKCVYQGKSTYLHFRDNGTFLGHLQQLCKAWNRINGYRIVWRSSLKHCVTYEITCCFVITIGGYFILLLGVMRLGLWTIIVREVGNGGALVKPPNTFQNQSWLQNNVFINVLDCVKCIPSQLLCWAENITAATYYA